MSTPILLHYYFYLCGVIFPIASCVVFAILGSIILAKDRYRRKLILKSNSLDEKLLSLKESNQIDNTQFELLQKSCNALPEVEEKTPLPDLKLRLAISFCKVYVVLNWVFAFAWFLGMCGLFILLKEDINFNYSGNIYYSISSVLILSLFLYLIWSWGSAVLHGKERWRTPLVICMTLYLLLDGISFDAPLFLAIRIVINILIMWSLGVIIWDKRLKYLFATLILASIVISYVIPINITQFNMAMKNNLVTTGSCVAETYSSDTYSQIRVEKIVLISAVPNDEIKSFTYVLSNAFKENFNVVTEVVPFNTKLKNVNMEKNLYLLVGKGIRNRPKIDFTLPEKFKFANEQIAKSLPQVSGVYGDTFILESPPLYHFYSSSYKGFNIPSLLSARLNATFNVNNATGEEFEKALAKLVQKDLIPKLEKYFNADAMSFPDFDLNKNEDIEFNFGLDEEQLLIDSCNIMLSSYKLYIFKKSSYERDLQLISNELSKHEFVMNKNYIGYIKKFKTPDKKNSNEGQVEIDMGREEKSNHIFYGDYVNKEYGIITYFKPRSTPFSAADKILLEKFKKFPKSFVLSRGLRHIPKAEQEKFIAELFSAGSIFTKIDVIENTPTDIDNFAKYFKLCVDEIFTYSQREEFHDFIMKMFNIEDTELKAYLIKKLGDRYQKIEITEECKKVELNFSNDELKKSKFIEVKAHSYNSLIYPITLWVKDDSKIILKTKNNSYEYERKDFPNINNYSIAYPRDWGKDKRLWISSFGSGKYHGTQKEDSMKVELKRDEKTDSFIFEINSML